MGEIERLSDEKIEIFEIAENAEIEHHAEAEDPKPRRARAGRIDIEADDILHQEGLLSIDTEVGLGVREPAPGWEQNDQGDEPEDDEAAEGGSKKGPDKDLPPRKKNAYARGSKMALEEQYHWLDAQARSPAFRRWFNRQYGRDGDQKAA